MKDGLINDNDMPAEIDFSKEFAAFTIFRRAPKMLMSPRKGVWDCFSGKVEQRESQTRPIADG